MGGTVAGTGVAEVGAEAPGPLVLGAVTTFALALAGSIGGVVGALADAGAA